MVDLKTAFGVKPHEVVSHDAWLAARRELLQKEKEFTRLRDELNEARRALPWAYVSAVHRHGRGCDGQHHVGCRHRRLDCGKVASPSSSRANGT